MPRVILKVLQKVIYGSHGRSPTNRSFGFRWSKKKSCLGSNLPPGRAKGDYMKEDLKPHIALSDRFFTAVTFAATMHRDQVRKSTDIPYICHP